MAGVIDIHESPVYQRTVSTILEMCRVMESVRETRVFDGHDQMMIRQLALLVIMTAKPKTGEVVDTTESFRTIMDHDFVMLLARLKAGEGLG